jgi:small subunit ribosomal protein S4
MMGPKGKLERKLNETLNLKAERSTGAKSVLNRRPNRPGQHGNKRQRRQMSDYGRQIRETLKFKLTYGLDDNNLRRLFAMAKKSKGDVAAKLIELFERRLQNVVYRSGIAPSRLSGRSFVVQGHIRVNNRKVVSPGYLVKVGDVVSIRPESQSKGAFKELKDALTRVNAPEWLAIDAAAMTAKVIAMPTAAEQRFEINLLVESFSK